LTVADTKIRPRRSASPAGAPPDVTGHPFKRSLPMLLMRAREAVMKRFRPHLRSHGVTEQQWRILLELSARCLIGPPSLSRTVPALAERGLVSREVHPDDGRRFLVSLTPAGRELFETMAAESARIYAELEGELAAAGLMAIYDMLSDLVDVLDPEELDE
jgi:homoprotocatechuate degradation regulator HpaR